MNTDRDWAEKTWLDLRATDDDPFVIISPDLAIVLLIVGGFIGFVFRSYL